MKLIVAAALLVLAAIPSAMAAPPSQITSSVGVCNYEDPSLCIEPNSDGSIDAAIAANVGGTTTALISCDSSVAINTATGANVELVALVASETVYVCGYNFIADGTVDVQLIFGTGTACATGETDLTGAYALTAQAGIVVHSAFFAGMKSDASEALCIELSAAVQIDGVVFYTQF